MAFSSLAQANKSLATMRSGLQSARANAAATGKHLMLAGEVNLAAAAAGYANGRFGDSAKVGSVSVPSLVGVLAIAAGAMSPGRKWAGHAVALGSGALAADLALRAHEMGKAAAAPAEEKPAEKTGTEASNRNANAFEQAAPIQGLRQIASDGAFGAGNVLSFSKPATDGIRRAAWV